MFVLCSLSMLLFGCTSQPTAEAPSKGLASSLLEKIGLQKIQRPEVDVPAKKYDIDVTIVAGDNLNAGNSQQPASVVMRIYYLRDATAFDRLTLEQAQNSDSERSALSDSLISAHELTLVPGQQVHLIESLSREASTLGIVALFHSPARFRWKFSFDAAAATASGITIGAHACAMTISRGEQLRKDELHNDALLTRTRCEDE